VAALLLVFSFSLFPSGSPSLTRFTFSRSFHVSRSINKSLLFSLCNPLAYGQLAGPRCARAGQETPEAGYYLGGGSCSAGY
jgi:hypothetical protein